MVGVLLLAAAFRFLAIDAAPPGWRDDELIEFGMDQRIAQGWRPLFITEAEGHEPFYHYLHAGTILLFGENIVGYKWLPFAFGLLTVALTFALAKRLFDVRVALLAAALMAVSFWPIMYARLGLRHIGVLPLMLGAFLIMWSRLSSRHGPTRRPTRKSAPLIAGTLLAAAMMTYFAGRALPVVLIGFLVYLLIFNRSILRKVWLPTVAAIVIAVAVAAPMFIEISRTPGAEKRTEVVGGPLIAAQHGNFRPAIDTTLGTLGMFTFAGDPESLYNVSGRPVFDWLTGIFFYLGVWLCLVRLKHVESGFALTWLLVGIAPAFVSLPAASFSHTIAAQPVVYMVAAYGVVEIVGKLVCKQGNKVSALSTYFLLSALVIGIGGWLTIRDYFGTWANDPFVRFQYHAPTRDIARWLDQNPDVSNVAIGTNPNELYLDPVALKLDLRRQDAKARWFNPESALVLLSGGVTFISPMQSPGVYIDLLLRAISHDRRIYRSDDILAFDIYHSDQQVGQVVSPATFGDSISLVPPHSDVQPASVLHSKPGNRIAAQALWRVEKSDLASRLKVFEHVLDAQNRVVVGEDREDVNALTLMRGDIFFQVNEITLPTDLAPGRYSTEIGWYDPATGVRLQLLDGTDRFLTEPIEVTAP